MLEPISSLRLQSGPGKQSQPFFPLIRLCVSVGDARHKRAGSSLFFLYPLNALGRFAAVKLTLKSFYLSLNCVCSS